MRVTYFISNSFAECDLKYLTDLASRICIWFTHLKKNIIFILIKINFYVNKIYEITREKIQVIAYKYVLLQQR